MSTICKYDTARKILTACSWVVAILLLGHTAQQTLKHLVGTVVCFGRVSFFYTPIQKKEKEKEKEKKKKKKRKRWEKACRFYYDQSTTIHSHIPTLFIYWVCVSSILETSRNNPSDVCAIASFVCLTEQSGNRDCTPYRIFPIFVI